MKRGDYKKAADKLEKVAKDVPKLDQEQRQNLSDELKRAGESLKDSDLDGLGGNLVGAGEAIEGNDTEGAQGKLNASSKQIRNFDLLKNRNQKLTDLLWACEDCKVCIAACCAGKGINPATGLSNLLSNTPKNGVGNKTSTSQYGDLTSLDSTLNLQQITGVQGEGNSTVQTSKVSAEGQESSLSYKDAYMKYQKLSEDALTQEQIPLGYKFYVKRYFESIKPTEE